MIIIKKIVFNPFYENTYVLHDSETKESVIIDPGCFDEHEKEELDFYIEQNDLKVVKLLNTHCHIDHVLGNAYIKQKYQVQLGIHKQDNQTLQAVQVYAPNYGFYKYQPADADYFIEEGEKITFGNSELEVLFVPGHAPGHVVFYNADQKFCINGDCLFNGSIGRTDLPGGDYDTLISSIQNKLFSLPDDMEVYCGHGPETTIGNEKKYNPFCKLA